ncbi:hypothetical protein GGR54DRAFT_550898 [Hypoxylon sp. NC1633]|nr:hypothetical protein GGR54DRAFT_550898 [Hypoxylon sp. NC1633]
MCASDSAHHQMVLLFPAGRLLTRSLTRRAPPPSPSREQRRPRGRTKLPSINSTAPQENVRDYLLVVRPLRKSKPLPAQVETRWYSMSYPLAWGVLYNTSYLRACHNCAPEYIQVIFLVLQLGFLAPLLVAPFLLLAFPLLLVALPSPAYLGEFPLFVAQIRGGIYLFRIVHLQDVNTEIVYSVYQILPIAIHPCSCAT